MNFPPKTLSGLIDLEDIHLSGRTFLSGPLEVFPNSISIIGTQLNPFNAVYADTFYNTNGELKINSATQIAPIEINTDKGNATIGLNHDNTLQITPDGQLSVVPKILLQSDLEIKATTPIKLILDTDVDPNDPIGSNIVLDYDEDDFNISDDGKLKAVPLKLVGQGAVGIREADLTLGETDRSLRVIKIDTSSDFTQNGGTLQIRSEGPGRIPFYQVGSGLASNGQFTFDGATTLSVPFIKLNTSYLLTNEYAASVAFVHYAYQAEMGSGIDILEPISNRRIVKARCDASSIFVDSTNNLAVKIDPSGALKKDVSLGLDLKIDATGAIKLDPGLGIDVKLDASGSIKNDPLLGLDTRLAPNGAIINTAGIGLSVLCDPSGVVFKDLPGLDIRVDEVSIQKTLGHIRVNLSQTDRGIQQLPDGLGLRCQTGDVIGSSYDGLFLKVSPNDSCLAKTLTGLEVAIAVDSPFVKEITGLDLKVGPTLKKTLLGLEGNYIGESPDITVTGNVIACHITASGKLQKVGNVISMIPEVEDAIDKVDDLAEGLDDVKDTMGDLQDMTDQLSNRLNNLDIPNTNPSVPKDNPFSQLGKSLGNAFQGLGQSLMSVFGGAVSGGVMGAGSSVIAGSSMAGASTLLNAAIAGSIGAGAGVLGGLIGGGLASTSGKGTTMGQNGISVGDQREGSYGFSIVNAKDYNATLYPDYTTANCAIVPLLGSNRTTIDSTSPYTGELVVPGGAGIAQNLYVGKNVYSNGFKLASEDFVTSRGYITNSALSGYATENFVLQKNYITSAALAPYLTSTIASTTYQQIITAGTGLTKSGNTLSVGTLANLTVSGTSSFNDLTKHYKRLENWETTITAPSHNLVAPNKLSFSNTAQRQNGFTAPATIDNLDLNPKILFGTVTYNGVLYPTFYAGTYTVSASISAVTINSITSTGGNITTSYGVSILRNGTITNYVQGASTGFMWMSGTYTNPRNFSLQVTVQDGDAIIVQSGVASADASITSFTGSVTWNTFTISANPKLLNAWDLSATGLSYYPDAKKINKLTFSNTGFSSDVPFTAPNLYDKTNVDTLLVLKMDKFDLSAYSTTNATNTLISNALVPYYTKSNTDTLLGNKQNLISVQTPLTLGVDAKTIGIDLSAYVTNSSLTTTLGSYVTSSSLTASLGSYYTKSATDTLLGGKMNSFDLTLYYNKTETNNLLNGKMNSFDLTQYYTKSATDTLLNGKMNSFDLTLYYNKTETNNLLNGKMNSFDLTQYYTKSATDTLLNGKMNSFDLTLYYNKTETNNLLNGKMNSFDLTQYYTKSTTDTLLNGKSNTFTVSSPLTYTNNVISGDIYSKGQIDAFLLGKQATVDFTNLPGLRSGSSHIGYGTPYEQGVFLAWNREVGSGSTYLMNQLGLGSGGFFFENWSKDNVLVSRMHFAHNGLLSVPNDISCPRYLYLKAGYDLNGQTSPSGALVFEYCQGGYKHFIRSRHNLNAAAGNAIDVFINNYGSQYGSTSPGVGNSPTWIMDATVNVSNVPLRIQNGIEFNSGNLNMVVGCRIIWGNNVSSIYDDGDLHIYTDDTMRFDTGGKANALVIQNNAFNINTNWLNFVSANFNTINFGTVGVAPPSFSNRSVGTKILLYPVLSATASDYAIGIDGSVLWNSVPSTSETFKWYHGNTQTMALTSSNLILSMAAARIEMSDSTNKFFIGCVKGDGAGDYHVYDTTSTRVVLGYFRTANKVQIGSDATSLFMGSRQVISAGLDATLRNVSLTGPLSFTMTSPGYLGTPQTGGVGSAGTRIVLFPNQGVDTVDMAIGTDVNTHWFSVPKNDASYKFKFFGSIYEVASIDGTGFTTVNSLSTKNGISSPGNLSITAQMGNGIIKTAGRFQIGNNVGNVLVDAGTNSDVTSTGSWYSTDALYPLRVIQTSSQPMLAIDWADMRNTKGGAFQCQGTARFDGIVCFTGKSYEQRDNGAYRFLHYNGMGTSSGLGNYAFLLNGRQLVTMGNQIDVFSDARLKQDIESINGEIALKVVKNLRSVGFKYKANAEQQRYGFIAQEVIKHDFVQNAVSIYKQNDQDEKYVFCENQMIPVLWAALRQLTAEVEILKSKK